MCPSPHPPPPNPPSRPIARLPARPPQVWVAASSTPQPRLLNDSWRLPPGRAPLVLSVDTPR